MIQRRHVFHIGGYDPVSPVEYHQRFLRQLDIFRLTWGLQAIGSSLDMSTPYPSWSVATSAPGWQTQSVVELLAWDDLVKKDLDGPRLVRLVRAVGAYLNLLVTGTLVRYGLANGRYFLFTIVPMLQTVILGVLAWGGVIFVASRVQWPPLVECVAVGFGGFGLFFVLLEWFGRRWRIYQALDDWILSLDYIYGRRQDLEARLDQFAARIVSRVQEGNTDEVIIVGHSLGATFALDAVARAFEIDPGLGRCGPISLVTVGATIPKCVLHPAAQRIRNRVNKIVENLTIYWVEYQSRADAISFYRFNPVTMKRIKKKENELDGKPIIRIVQTHDMLRAETFAKYRFRVLRLHYQFVSANDRRASYDYFMMICGPLAVRTWTKSQLGFLEFFDKTRNPSLVTAERSA
jgi:pimeloyl-ACP methyl ester carboxylesterase